MWKVVYHQELGEGFQFNPYDQGMPNITVGKDVRRIQFKAVNPKPQRRFMMVVHNQFDFQDALVLYSFESLFEKGEIKYVRNISINQTCILKACCSILTSGKPNWRKKSYRPIRRKKILARNTLKRPVS